MNPEPSVSRVCYIIPGSGLGRGSEQSWHQIDRVEEADLLAVVDQCGSKRDGDVSFACPGSADQDEVVRLFGELTRAEGFDLGLTHRGRAVIEGGEVLMMGELRDAHLILDGTHPPLYGFRVDQLLYRCGQTWWLARGQQIMGASCHSMQPQGRQLVDESVHAAASSAEQSAS